MFKRELESARGF